MSRQAEARAQDRGPVREDKKSPAQVDFVDPGKSGKKPNKESPKPTPSCGWCGREKTSPSSMPCERCHL